jgi:serine/threonine protein phosphatase 1
VKKAAKLCHIAGLQATEHLPAQRRRVFFLIFTKSGRKSASAPEGVRLYAIGDIHGRLDLLDQLLDLIRSDRSERPEAPLILIFLGDYIDRGPESKGVVDRLLEGFPEADASVFLKGNHEDLLLSFIRDRVPSHGWLRNGGDAALASYGVDLATISRAYMGSPEDLAEAAEEFRSLLPASHLEFYENLKLSCRFGDYFFVHAGVNPDAPLDRQDEEDLIWIREPFLSSKRDFGAVVVHGHTPTRFPQDLGNRIALDTYAVRTGKLTAIRMEGNARRFLST